MRFVQRLPEERANVSPGNPLIELAQLVLGGLAAIALLLWLAGFAVDAAAARISPERERELFGWVVDAVRADEPADRERLERVFTRLGPAEPRPALGVLDTPELNALALPGGAILVTRGLLDEVDDDELAFVLAHELAHLEHRDNLRSIGRGVVLAVALSMLGFEASAAADDVGGLASRVSLARFGRGREEAADAAAVARMLDRGFEAEGAVRLLDRLREREGRGDRLLAWLATHPLGERRIAAVRAAIQER